MMVFLRSKNAKMLTMIAAILVVVVILYINLISRKEAQNKEVEKPQTPTKVQQVLDMDFDNNYPASVREVVKAYLKITQCYYMEEELSDDDIVMLADKQRELMSDELLKKNNYSEFMERLKKEIESYRKSGTKMTEYTVGANETIKYWYHEAAKMSSVEVTLNMTGEMAGKVCETFILTQDKSEEWKIIGYKLSEDEKDNQES